jgi:hypothetical protein
VWGRWGIFDDWQVISDAMDCTVSKRQSTRYLQANSYALPLFFECDFDLYMITSLMHSMHPPIAQYQKDIGKVIRSTRYLHANSYVLPSRCYFLNVILTCTWLLTFFMWLFFYFFYFLFLVWCGVVWFQLRLFFSSLVIFFQSQRCFPLFLVGCGVVWCGFSWDYFLVHLLFFFFNHSALSHGRHASCWSYCNAAPLVRRASHFSWDYF